MFKRREIILAISCIGFGEQNAFGITLDAPNLVEITPYLVTSGQPTPQSLADLASQGIQVVIYLAPSSVPDAVKNEGELLLRQGIEYIHIPIPFDAPKEEHFKTVSAALVRSNDKKILVHCQVNMRASTMVFLHRTITLGENPTHAYQAMSKIWSPNGPWRKLVIEQLKNNNISFQLL
jgi:protein tyrosine phosphatase (PTP) superfamily phosphohydrolase (DUF442 family)